jgi:hypothetical protein
MKKKLALAVLTASFYVAFPLVAQNNGNHGEGNNGNHGEGNNGNHGQGNHGHHHGNNSNHSGHDDDGNSAGHRKDRPHGFGDDDNLVLATPTITAAVATAVTSVNADLKSGSLVTPAGTVIPGSAQARTYALLNADPALAPSATEISAALSTAGPEASALVPSLMRGFAGLRSDPAQLPSVVAQYNGFTKVASSTFISSPPPEFIALHTVLARLVSAAGSTK